jgi:hypothetical protein
MSGCDQVVVSRSWRGSSSVGVSVCPLRARGTDVERYAHVQHGFLVVLLALAGVFWCQLCQLLPCSPAAVLRAWLLGAE